MHIHFIGICGTFMAGLARIACELGHTVTGSDREFYPPMSEQLQQQGIKTYRGFGADIWNDIHPDLVVVGNVCSRGMPIIESMLEKGLDYTHGPHWLGEQVLKHRHVIAVAGTHGKTTTTAMLTHILHQCGVDTGYLIGGVVPALPASAALGDSDYFVIEADEYDSAYFDKRPKLIHYHPNTLVIGNVEYDHADIYEHVGQIERQFHYGVRLVPPSGTVIFGPGQNVQNVSDQGVWSRVIDLNTGDYTLADRRLFHRGEAVAELPAQLIGAHNCRNAMMACLAAQPVGLSVTRAANALKNFGGVKRRLECLGEIGGIRVYDDFAHHPTAVKLTLSAMHSLSTTCETCSNKRVVSVLEPRSNTMKMGTHTEELREALTLADKSYVYLPDDMGWQLHGNSVIMSDINRLCQCLVNELQPGDEVVIMSNGSFDGLHQRLLQGLKAKYR